MAAKALCQSFVAAEALLMYTITYRFSLLFFCRWKYNGLNDAETHQVTRESSKSANSKIAMCHNTEKADRCVF